MLNLHTYGLPEYEWIVTANGNYVCIHEDDLIATVFSKGHEWQIIINSDGVGRIVADEAFNDPNDATERAEDILNGADCTLVKMKTKDETTSWQQQKTVANGSPTSRVYRNSTTRHLATIVIP